MTTTDTDALRALAEDVPSFLGELPPLDVPLVARILQRQAEHVRAASASVDAFVTIGADPDGVFKTVATLYVAPSPRTNVETRDVARSRRVVALGMLHDGRIGYVNRDRRVVVLTADATANKIRREFARPDVRQALAWYRDPESISCMETGEGAGR